MKSKLTLKHKMMAYVLSVEFGYTMEAIGTLMKVSQSTISNAIKDMRYQITIKDLRQELIETKQLLLEQGFSDPNIIDI